MKKYVCMLAFVAGLSMITSCSNSEADEVINNDSKIMTFKVSSPSTVGTRATVKELHTNGETSTVIWEGGDQISVFGDQNFDNHVLTYKSEGNKVNNAIFSGMAFASDHYYFMYPYQEDATFNGSVLKATIPSVQQATINSFDPQAAICGGKADKGSSDVTLSHACSFLMVETMGDCEYVKIVAADNDAWCFTGGVELREQSAGTPITISEATGGKKYAQLQANRNESEVNPTSTFPAGKYLIAIASSTGFPQLKVIVKYKGKNAIYATSSNSGEQYNAGFVRSLGQVPVPTN